MSIEYILSIGEYLYYLNFVSILIAFCFAYKSIRLNSTLLSLQLMLLFSFLMTSYTPGLHSASMKYHADYLHEFRFLWFVGFSLLDLLLIGLLLTSHNKFGMRLSFSAYAVVVAFSLKLLLHVSRYFEKEVYLTNYLEPIYTKGIPIINMTFAAVVFGFVLTVLASIIYTKITKKKGLSWFI